MKDIVEVIGEYISLNKIGRNYFCVCPFHYEGKDALSLSISPEKQVFRCFVCGAMGNANTFTKMIESTNLNKR